jgi:hypothetical protein
MLAVFSKILERGMLRSFVEINVFFVVVELSFYRIYGVK